MIKFLFYRQGPAARDAQTSVTSSSPRRLQHPTLRRNSRTAGATEDGRAGASNDPCAAPRRPRPGRFRGMYVPPTRGSSRLSDLGPAVRRTGRRLLRTKSRVLSISSLSDIFSHAHASYLVATSFNYCRGQSDYGSPRDPPATKKNYLATRFNECAPPCTRCSSSEGRLKTRTQAGAGRAIDKIRPDARRFRVHVTQLTAHRCGKELS